MNEVRCGIIAMQARSYKRFVAKIPLLRCPKKPDLPRSGHTELKPASTSSLAKMYFGIFPPLSPPLFSYDLIAGAQSKSSPLNGRTNGWKKGLKRLSFHFSLALRGASLPKKRRGKEARMPYKQLQMTYVLCTMLTC